MKTQQAELFIWFIVLGGLNGFGYDFLRAFRKELRHSQLIITIEDILYGIIIMAACYTLFFWKNQGALRAYGFLGAAGGAAIYFLTLSPIMLRFWRLLWKLILLPVRAVKKLWKRIRKVKWRKKEKSIDE